MLDIGRIHVTSFHYTHTVKLVHSVLYLLPPTHNNLFPVLFTPTGAHVNARTHSHIHTLLSISECVLEDLMPCNMSEIMTDKTKMEICCTFHGKARSICAKYTGISIGSKATFTTSDHFCTETGSTKTCTEGLTWSGVAAKVSLHSHLLENSLHFFLPASTQEENRNAAVKSSGYVFPVSFVVSSETLLGAVGLALKGANKSRRGT